MVKQINIGNNLKILFCNPPWFEDGLQGKRYGVRAGSRWSHTSTLPHGYKPMPVFMMYAAANARKEGFDVTFRDSVCIREPELEFFQYLEKEKFDVVIVETQTPSYKQDMAICAEIGKFSKVIVCGPNMSYQPIADETLALPFVHSVLQFEYDKNVVTALKSMEPKIFGSEFLTVDEMNTNPGPLIEMAPELLARYIDTIPFPRPLRDGKSRWTDALTGFRRGINLQYFSSRGCARKCIYCVWPSTFVSDDPRGENKRSVRMHSKEWLVNSLTDVLTRYPHINSIYLDDDITNHNKSHSMKLCEVFRELAVRFPERTCNGKFVWSMMAFSTTIKKEVWAELYDSGMYGAKVGFESGSQRVLDEIVNKNLNLEKASDMAEYLTGDLGILLHGTFSTGHPGETPEEVKQTMDFMKWFAALPNTTAQHSGSAPTEGTPLWYVAQGEKLAKYPGAIPDANFINESDGQKKIEQMREKGLL